MFFDRINRINKIFLFSLYLPAGRHVLNILSILSKKWDFLYIQANTICDQLPATGMNKVNHRGAEDTEIYSEVSAGSSEAGESLK